MSGSYQLNVNMKKLFPILSEYIDIQVKGLDKTFLKIFFICRLQRNAESQ